MLARPDYGQLIKPDRVHGSLYTEPEIFAEELERIWYRTWVFVGHESEVAQPGDYVRTSIGLQDVIMTRGADGAVHLLLNRCAHRGNLVCEASRGNARSFRCPYHGWTYRNTGELIGFPFNQGYGGRGTIESELSLARVPRVDSHRGFVFGSMTADGPGLAEHLGEARRRAGPAGTPVAGGRSQAHRGLAASPHPGQLEAARGERDRRLPSSVRARLDLQRDRQSDRKSL